jgi:hypothetical protein
LLHESEVVEPEVRHEAVVDRCMGDFSSLQVEAFLRDDTVPAQIDGPDPTDQLHRSRGAGKSFERVFRPRILAPE